MRVRLPRQMRSCVRSPSQPTSSRAALASRSTVWVVSASRRPLTRSAPMAALPVYSTGLLPVRGIRPASAPGTEKASSSMFPRAKTV